MRRAVRSILAAALSSAILLADSPARAHVTPPLRLASDKEAVSRLLPGAEKRFVREVRLSDAERAMIERQAGWSPDRGVHRVHVGRDAEGRVVGAVLFVTEYAMHGPLRVAVALGPDGRVRGATVVEVSEESYPWIRQLIDQDFVRDYVGQDAHGEFALTDRLQHAVTGAMPRFYGRVLTGLLQRAALLFEVGVLQHAKPGGTPPR
jgi:Na+-translocating ferredoxin:NAD+ oxidoreductase RnfG subunit